MKLINTTQSDITVKYKGVEYTLDAEGSIEVPEEVGTWWKGIHSFLEEVKSDKPKVEAVNTLSQSGIDPTNDLIVTNVTSTSKITRKPQVKKVEGKKK